LQEAKIMALSGNAVRRTAFGNTMLPLNQRHTRSSTEFTSKDTTDPIQLCPECPGVTLAEVHDRGGFPAYGRVEN
jgi:hypothetical protein